MADKKYKTSSGRSGYQSDVSDSEWTFCCPYLVLMDLEAPQRTYDLDYSECGDAVRPPALVHLIFLRIGSIRRDKRICQNTAKKSCSNTACRTPVLLLTDSSSPGHPQRLTELLPHAVVQALGCQHLDIRHPREHPADEFPPGNREDMERLAQYIIRNPFSVDKIQPNSSGANRLEAGDWRL